MSQSKYLEDLTPLLAFQAALSGARNDEIAEKLGVKRAWFQRWLARYPELRMAVTLGKEAPDQIAFASYFRQMVGYDYEEITRERQTYEDKNGRIRSRMVITKKVKKHNPGEPGLKIFWAKNRWRWTDRMDVAHSGELSVHHDLSKLSDEELRTFQRLTAKVEEPNVHGDN